MTDDNRDLFIKNNLKTVIECAKRYRCLGVDFEDLIQIGNMGLLKAWYKFDTSKSDLQDNIINDINEHVEDIFTYKDAVDIITHNFKYPKLLEQTVAKIPDDGFSSKESFIDWAKDNIRKASFASLGFIWARAAITSELNGLSAMKLAAKYKKPTLIGRVNNEGEIKGSIRNVNNCGLESLKDFLTESKLFDYVQGHDNAAGHGIHKNKLDSFHK